MKNTASLIRIFLFYFVFQEGETALHYVADLEPNKGEDMYEYSDIAKLLLEYYADASSVTYLVCTIPFFIYRVEFLYI